MDNIIQHQKQGLDMLSRAMGLPTVEEMLQPLTQPVTNEEIDDELRETDPRIVGYNQSYEDYAEYQRGLN